MRLFQQGLGKFLDSTAEEDNSANKICGKKARNSTNLKEQYSFYEDWGKNRRKVKSNVAR